AHDCKNNNYNTCKTRVMTLFIILLIVILAIYLILKWLGPDKINKSRHKKFNIGRHRKKKTDEEDS
ncbi:MAG: hypothetical protein ACSLE0_06435, partial [Chitinophagaceae bacterium]